MNIDTAATAAHPAFDDGSMVVVMVLAIVMIGVFAFMFMTERKLSRVEKELKND